MSQYPPGTISVIFISTRTPADDTGYGQAAEAMEALARQQDGYLGIDSARGEDGTGITVSYWRDEEAAIAWRDNAEHRRIRDTGRQIWYSRYSLHVATVGRSYDWEKKK